MVWSSGPATLGLQLAGEGALSLDDIVRPWLDDAAVARIPHTGAITLRQLLTHTSGVYDYQDAFFGPGADWARVWTPPELLAYAGGAAGRRQRGQPHLGLGKGGRSLHRVRPGPLRPIRDEAFAWALTWPAGAAPERRGTRERRNPDDPTTGG
jgi:hypothetical protein